MSVRIGRTLVESFKPGTRVGVLLAEAGGSQLYFISCAPLENYRPLPLG